MNIIYIGQNTLGTTSRMRFDLLMKILQPHSSQIIDTHIPFYNCYRFWRSFGFRFKKGPLISRVNKYINQEIEKNKEQKPIDLIWVDKAVFLTEETTLNLRKITNKLVHFTPDPAFTFHKSKLFEESLPHYDYAITTKSFEIDFYSKYLPKNNVIYVTQGYDENLHKAKCSFEKKEKGVLFIGHCEESRKEIVKKLIDSQIEVSVAGINWKRFVRKNKNSYLSYIGNGIYGQDYADKISSHQFSWGALSKWIPELHTTRTFEIPACGTALITEYNQETKQFFKEDEVIFYSSVEDMIEKIRYYQNHSNQLFELTQKGMKRVQNDGRDYESILKRILRDLKVIE
jgi:spore maturation protein CgeB